MAAEASREARVDQRRLSDFLAYVREPTSDPVAVRVLDLSVDGCRIISDLALEQGTTVWIKLPSVGARRARVAWSRHNEAGCQFSSVLDEKVVEKLAPEA